MVLLARRVIGALCGVGLYLSPVCQRSPASPLDISYAKADQSSQVASDDLSRSTQDTAKAVYENLLKTGTQKQIQRFHRNLYNTVVNLIAVMSHDPTGGLHEFDQDDYTRIRNKLKTKSNLFDTRTNADSEIVALVDSLRDPYSKYIPSNYDALNTADDTLFPNIGIGVAAYFDGAKNAYLGSEVVAVYPESPAERVGLKIGDLITDVNGLNLSKLFSKTLLLNRPPEDFNRRVNVLLSGPDGSDLELCISSRQPQRRKSTYRLGLTRSSRHLYRPGFVYRPLEDSSQPVAPIAYVRMESFSKRNTEYLERVLKKERPRGGALVLDLRNNYGGVLQEALFDACLFLRAPSDVLCFLVSPRGFSAQTVDKWRDRGAVESYSYDTPLVLLQNEGTASSAEVFIASLRENGRVLSVGTRSYGKALIQHFFDLPNGGSLKLTVAEYLTPGRHHIVRNVLAAGDRGGLEPDVLCADQVGADPSEDQCVLRAQEILLDSMRSSHYMPH